MLALLPAPRCSSLAPSASSETEVAIVLAHTEDWTFALERYLQTHAVPSITPSCAPLSAPLTWRSLSRNDKTDPATGCRTGKEAQSSQQEVNLAHSLALASSAFL